MQSAFQNIGASLAPITSAPTSSVPPPTPGTPTGGGGKFTFEPDEVAAISKEWLELAQEYEVSISTAERLISVDPAGDEYASQFHAQRANESGGLYVESLVQKQDYCYSQAQKFKDAHTAYLGVDRVNVREIESAGGSPLPPGGI